MSALREKESGGQEGWKSGKHGGGVHASRNLEKKFRTTLPFDQQWITAKGVTAMKSAVGSVVAGFFVSMAAIPIVMGILIFAPVFIPLAIVCVVLESSRQ